MKINITTYDKPYCTLEVDMDIKEAIKVGDNMSEDKFAQIFAHSIFASLHDLAEKEDTDAVLAYIDLRNIVEFEWNKFTKNMRPDEVNQELFDKFLDELITSTIQFIPVMK